MKTELKFDAEIRKNDLEFYAIRRNDLIESLAFRKRHEKLLNKILIIDFTKVLIAVILTIVLLVKL